MRISDWSSDVCSSDLHDRTVTIFDVSGLPSEVQPTIVGTMLRVVYDILFWAQDLPIGGRQQPLLVVLDEAHRFLPAGVETSAYRTLSMIRSEERRVGKGRGSTCRTRRDAYNKRTKTTTEIYVVKNT